MKLPLIAGMLSLCMHSSALNSRAFRFRRLLMPLGSTVRSYHQGGGRSYGGSGRSRSTRSWLLGGAVFTAGAVYSQQESMQLSAGAEGAETSDFSDTALYPPTKPIQTGKIKVSDIHTLAFTVYGNPNGKPV